MWQEALPQGCHSYSKAPEKVAHRSETESRAQSRMLHHFPRGERRLDQPHLPQGSDKVTYTTT